jgi:hypothetical protein
MIHEATTIINNKQSQSATDVKTDMTDYIEFISNKYKSKLESNFKNKWSGENDTEKEKVNEKIKDKERIDDNNISIPKFNEYELLYKYNYNVHQLKSFTKHYKLKISGNKPQLVARLVSFLFLSQNIVVIQKVFRGYLHRKCYNCHGPAAKNRSICNNDSDFFSTEELKDIPFENFFSYKDEDNFVYGFELLSIYNLIYKCNGVIKNPYNRRPITGKVVENLKTLLRLSKVLRIPICTEIKDITLEMSCKKSIELRTLALFQNIDALGNYSDPKWFMNLNRTQLVRLLRELIDIWTYRANLTDDTKREICPPVGNPFGRLSSFSQVQNSDNLDDVRKYILEVLEKFVNVGINRDSKCLGAYYVLGAITLVSPDAAAALPWLYQALNYQ